MRHLTAKSLWMVWFLLFSAMAFCQEKLPLKSVFTALEQQHNIKFNYTEETISGYKVTPPNAAWSLQKQLESIQSQAPFGFEIIGNYVVVTAPVEPAATDNPMTYDLNEVVIENFLTSGISKKKYGNFEIKPEKFGILPGLTEPDVLQTMQQIPGIYSVDESISNLNIRGGTHDQNLFLWNGIRMFQTGHFYGLISAFNPMLAQTISVYKNGTPVSYGENVSGVADISSRESNIAPSKFGIGANLISIDGFAKVKMSEKAAVTVSGRRSYTEWANTPTYQSYYNRMFQNTIVTRLDNNQIVDYRTGENFFFYDFTAQYHQKIGDKHEFFVDGIGIKNELDIRQNATVDGTASSKLSSLEQQSLGASLQWRTVWNADHSTRINGYVSSYDLDAVNESVENNQVLQQQNEVSDMGLAIEHKQQVNAEVGARYGYQFNEMAITNTDYINTPRLAREVTELMRTHAGTAEIEYAPADKSMLVKGGLRINYFEQLDQVVVEPRLQFSYTLTPTLKVEILGEQKSQTISQTIDLQRDFLGIEKRRWTLADAETPLQKSGQLSIGLSFQNPRWMISFDNFYKRVTGISSQAQAFQNQLEMISIKGNYTVGGSELLVRHNWERFYGWVSYSLNRNEYHFDNFDPEMFPSNFEVEHSVSAAAVYDQKKFKVALGGKWNSGRPTTVPASFDEGAINYGDPNGRALGAYLQINLSASYSWEIGKTRIQANAAVLNLLDRDNVLNRYYRVNTLTNEIERVNTYAMQRTPNLSVRWYF
ncbi:TonB-dependent receptor plug domain-containing protein [Flavobacterium caeni]|uniref:Outer membrane receptor proteins, mostly Fe transport n=1 Tax=Flavobacterium caeni TaxID=490189 RepID=A0A1G5FS75_9FLAO|nr:TonB-dependent receptor plug domain-containing protein [Flavobacterium caeni]SCY42222.1 Outer membrane receptor proteins, mostly Fe transport [Flavobacterium caeni]